MANYYTRFSCVLPVGSPENIQRAYDAFAEYADHLKLDEEVPAFCVTHDAARSEMLITSGDGSGDPDQVAAYAAYVGPSCGLAGPWGFVWSYTCDRDQTDGFGGGALVLDLADGRILDAMSCDEWLVGRLSQLLAAQASAAGLPAL
jgi:hypothetical protein